MLKTYITKVESLKKFNVSHYLKYLISSTHANHLGRTQILNNSQDHREFFRLNADKIRGNIRFKQDMKRNKKQNWHKLLIESNKSLVFAVPVSYEASNEELIEIQEELTKMIIEEYYENGVELDYTDLFSNIHKQGNDHINFIIPSIGKDFQTIRFIRDLGFRPRLAQKFTKIVDKVLNKSFQDYNKDNDTLTLMTREEERFRNGDFTLEELEELSNKPYKNKMLKNLYKMFVRIKKQELELKEQAEALEEQQEKLKKRSKTIRSVEKTLKKLEAGKEATKEEKQLARDILSALNADAIISDKQRKELKKGTKAYNNHQAPTQND